MITMSSSVPEFLLLSATLLDALPSSSPSMLATIVICLWTFGVVTDIMSHPVDDTLLLQLHIVFGPMLMSALQLIDRREGKAKYLGSHNGQ